MLEKPELKTAALHTIASKITTNSKNATMRGLCHSCFSTGVDTTFDGVMSPICGNCISKKEKIN